MMTTGGEKRAIEGGVCFGFIHARGKQQRRL